MIEDHKKHYRDNLAAYALGALDGRDIRLLEDHLESCQECRVELEDYLAVSEGLLSALPPRTPPSSLKKRVITQLPNKRKTSGSSLSWFFTQFSFGQLATAAVIIVLLGFNLFSTLQIQGLQRTQTELVLAYKAEQSAIAMLAYPGTQKISVNEGSAGSLLLNPDTNTAILFTWELAELPEDKVYQMWLIDARGNRVSGGIFVPDAQKGYTLTQVQASSSLTDYVGLGVTIEPRGGSAGPTGPNVLKVNF